MTYKPSQAFIAAQSFYKSLDGHFEELIPDDLSVIDELIEQNRYSKEVCHIPALGKSYASQWRAMAEEEPSIIPTAPNLKFISKSFEEDWKRLYKNTSIITENERYHKSSLETRLTNRLQDIGFVRPSEIMDEPSETMDQSSEIMDQSSETIDQSSETMDQSSETMDQSSETMDQSSEIMDEPSETMDQSSETMDQSSETIDQPSETMDESSSSSVIEINREKEEDNFPSTSKKLKLPSLKERLMKRFKDENSPSHFENRGQNSDNDEVITKIRKLSNNYKTVAEQNIVRLKHLKKLAYEHMEKRKPFSRMKILECDILDHYRKLIILKGNGQPLPEDLHDQMWKDIKECQELEKQIKM